MSQEYRRQCAELRGYTRLLALERRVGTALRGSGLAEESSGLSALLDKILSHWQRNNLWGLTQWHAQMGFNECGDDNDDNYSNFLLSLHPREVSAAFCHLTKFERWPFFLSLFCNVLPRVVKCFSAFTSLKSAYAQQCARYSGGCKRKMRLSGETWAILTLMPGPGAGVCIGNPLKQKVSGVRTR